MASGFLLPNVVSEGGPYFSACIEITSKRLWRLVPDSTSDQEAVRPISFSFLQGDRVILHCPIIDCLYVICEDINCAVHPHFGCSQFHQNILSFQQQLFSIAIIYLFLPSSLNNYSDQSSICRTSVVNITANRPKASIHLTRHRALILPR